MYGKSVTCYAHKPLFAASIPSIPQGFALSTDVVFAKVHDIFAVFLLFIPLCSFKKPSHTNDEY